MGYLAAAAIIAGTGVSAYSSYSSGKKQEDAANKVGDSLSERAQAFGITPQVTATNPNLGNSSLAALAQLGQSQTGFPSGAILQQGSPIGTLLNAVGASGFDADELSRRQRTISAVAQVYQSFRKKGLSPGEAKQKTIKRKGKEQWSAFRMAASQSNYTSPVELLEAQNDYETQIAQIQQENLANAPQLRANRNDAILNASKIASSMPDVSREGILALEERARSLLTRRSDENVAEQRRFAAEQAQTFGTNPAGPFGEIAEQGLQTRQDIDDIEALRFALGLAGGQTTLANQTLSGIGNFINQPAQALGAASGQFSQGQQFQGTLAQNQANALNNLGLNIELARLGALNNADVIQGQGQLASIAGQNAALQSIAGLLTDYGTSGGFGGGSQGGLSTATDANTGISGIDSFNANTTGSNSFSNSMFDTGYNSPAGGS